MEDIQKKILLKLINFRPAKWGASHTDETNLRKCLPKHLRGEKIVDIAIDELYHRGFLTRLKKNGQWHVSLQPRMKEEIYRFVGLPPR